MNDKQNLGIISITYLTICGGIYHLTYWSTFNINGLAIFSISEILKSSIYPIIGSFQFTIISMVTYEFLVNPEEFFKKAGKTDANFTFPEISKWAKLFLLFFWLTMVITLCLITNPNKWTGWACITGLLPASVLINNNFLMNYFGNGRLRRWAIMILLYLPLFSFGAGKLKSETILMNYEYDYTTRDKLKDYSLPDTLKLLGFSDNHVIFTDLGNAQNYMFKTEIFDVIQLQRKK